MELLLVMDVKVSLEEVFVRNMPTAADLTEIVWLIKTRGTSAGSAD